MKHAPTIAGALLGLLFVVFGLVVLLKLVPQPELPPDTAAYHFMAALAPTGYLTFVKVLEVLGGLLVAIPRTRILGLLVLGPIIVNILAYHIFITRGEGLLSPVLIIIGLLAAFLLWTERRTLLPAAVIEVGTRKAWLEAHRSHLLLQTHGYRVLRFLAEVLGKWLDDTLNSDMRVVAWRSQTGSGGLRPP